MLIDKSTVSFQTAQFPALFCSYISNAQELSSLHSGAPTFENIVGSSNEINFSERQREVLAEVLTAQYSILPQSLSDVNTVLDKIQLLKNKKAFTVCTGHQLCIFTGPLYFIYKVISCIKLSKKLNNQFPEKHFVPVYWMASEDHDQDEVREINISDKQYVWDPEQNKDTVTGALGTTGIDVLVSAIENDLGDRHNNVEILKLLNEAYTSQKNLADATRFILHTLFGKYGLVIIDARDRRLKEQFSYIIREDIEEKTSEAIVAKTSEEIKGKGFKPQVNARAVNLFLMKDNIRYRIDEHPDGFELKGLGKVLNKSDLLELLNSHPEQFSPNVVLRPLYQQCILPNCAYVGGPSEIAYWLQLRGLFKHYKVPFPILMPRLSATIIGKAGVQVLEKLGMSDEDLFTDEKEIEAKIVQESSGLSHKINDSQSVLDKGFDSLKELAKETDASIVSYVEANKKQLHKFLQALEKKLLRAEKQEHEVMLRRLGKLRSIIFPKGILQERQESFVGMELMYGPGLIELLMDVCDPEHHEMLLLKEREK